MTSKLLLIGLAALTVGLAKANGTVCGNARFTALTDRLIRMEYAADGCFEDRPSQMIVNRAQEVPLRIVRLADGAVSLDTGKVKIVYRGGAFTSDTLSATFEVAGRPASWRFGDGDAGNLMGTRRTLDWVWDWDSLRDGPRGKMEKGILSRDGWVLVDDSRTYLMENGWAAARRSGERSDYYLFAYGHDYRGALGDYVQVAGRIPMPPRYVFGYWWSRYWQYSDVEFKDLVRSLKSMDIPIDVLVVDMDWHPTWERKDDARRDWVGSRLGWTGYSWEKSLFPDPDGFFSWCHRENLKTTLNLHPASGIMPNEDCYARFAADYGWKEKDGPVPFRIEDPKWVDCYFKDVIGPLEGNGVDFWWLDWQQWPDVRTMPGLSNTYWLNRLFFEHAAGRGNGVRPLIYHRWGGLGSHRYQIGFSGDVSICWEALSLLPYFTATAANVGYGYWGHDCGGHKNYKLNPPEAGGAYDQKNPVFLDNGKDGELFLRWLQAGVFMPVFKTHPGKEKSIERRIWKYPEHFEMMRDAFHLRYRLAPYLYTAARASFDTGVSMCRPLYYDWPELDEAYERKLPEYMLGDDLLAVTVASPADKTTGLSTVDFYLPPGIWYDASVGELLEGGRTLSRRYALYENPRFLRAGAVLPLCPDDVRNLQAYDNSRVVFEFVPGGNGGSTALYEDDGLGADYETACARTPVRWIDDGNSLLVEIGVRSGKYKGAPKCRSYELRFPLRGAARTVLVNGRAVVWEYDARELALVVRVPEVSADERTVVKIELADADPKSLNGLKGLFARLRQEVADFKEKYVFHLKSKSTIPAPLLSLSTMEGRIQATPERLAGIVATRAKDVADAKRELEDMSTAFPPGCLSRLEAALGIAEP